MFQLKGVSDGRQMITVTEPMNEEDNISQNPILEEMCRLKIV